MAAKNAEGLTDQRLKFCQLYHGDPEKNATKAYMGAYPKATLKAAETAASRLLQNVKVQAYLEKLRQDDEKQSGVDRQFVLEKLQLMAEVGLTKRDIINKAGDVVGEKFNDGYVGSKGVELLGKHYKMFTDKVEHGGELKLTGVLRIGVTNLSLGDWIKGAGATVKTET